MSQKSDFINQMYQAGLKAGLTDAAARVMAAQSGIESAYGERAPGNNFFAITKGPDWTGPTVTRTDKDASGNPIKQQFRVYDSPEAGIADRISYMDKHFPGFSKASTVDAALSTLQNGTYGKYYQAPKAKYEAAVTGINSKYLPATTAPAKQVAPSHPVPPRDIPNPSGIIDLTKGGTVGKYTIPADAYATRARTEPIKGVVFHHTGGGSLSGAIAAGQKGGAQPGTGSTYYIDTDGKIYRYAPDSVVRTGIRDPGNKFRTDAGKPTSALNNGNTISVEVVAPDSSKFTPAQKEAAASLGAYLSQTYKIDPSMIVGHGDIQGGPGGNKQPTEGVSLASYVRQTVSSPDTALAAANRLAGVTDPQNVSAFANTGTGVPLPRPRPQIGLGALGATAGSVSAGALGNTSTLGWDPQYGHTTAGETIRGVQSPADYARARLTAGNPANLDPRLMSLGQPANAMGLGASAVGGAIPAAPVPMNRPIAPVVAPTPMAGRPAAVDQQQIILSKPTKVIAPAVAKPVIPETPPAQTIRVGKHDYVIGQTFNQGGRHYIVTPSGIESSSIPTGEPTVMSGIIGSVIKSAAPAIGAGLNTAAGKASHDIGNMGASLGAGGTKIGNSLTSTAAQVPGALLNFGNTLSSIFNKNVGGGVSAGGLGSAGTTGALGTATLAAQPRPTLVASGGVRTAPGLTGSSWLKAPGVMTATGTANAGTGVGGLASLVGGAAAAPVIKPVAVAAPKNKPAPVVAAAPKAATVTGTATGRSYQIGATYSNKDGTFKASAGADGKAKFTKVA